MASSGPSDSGRGAGPPPDLLPERRPTADGGHFEGQSATASAAGEDDLADRLGNRSQGGNGRRHVVLVGMMGTGKTTVGTIVARRLGRPFVDSDAQVMARTGRTVAEIWEAEGEDVFRRLEAEVLAAALAAEEPAVVAAAGGVVKDPENRRRMRDAGTVVWLRADPATLVPRVRRGLHRPLVREDPLGVLTRLDEERAGLYREVAHEVVDVEGRGASEIAELIAGWVT